MALPWIIVGIVMCLGASYMLDQKDKFNDTFYGGENFWTAVQVTGVGVICIGVIVAEILWLEGMFSA